jgi:hypothetical protein
MNMNHVHDCVGHDLHWVESSGGVLSPREKRAVTGALLRGYLALVRSFIPLWTHRRGRPLEAPVVPDSRLVKLAQEAALDVPQAVANHGYRTFAFGGALSRRDGARLDPELFYVGALLHDTGLVRTLSGEDFTLRGARFALRVCERAGTSTERSRAIADSIVSHFEPGLRCEADPLGFYIQAGALLDLVGARMRELPEAYLRDVYAKHPQHGMRPYLRRQLAEEARAMPDGRAALLNAAGLRLAIHISVTRSF